MLSGHISTLHRSRIGMHLFESVGAEFLTSGRGTCRCRGLGRVCLLDIFAHATTAREVSPWYSCPKCKHSTSGTEMPLTS